MLATSLHLRANEASPAVPRELVEDVAPVNRPASAERPKRVASIWRFLSSPAFGVAAAALLILAFVAPSLLEQAPEARETFRGGASEVRQDSPVTLVLVAAPADVEAGLRSSGAFDLEIAATESYAAALALPGRRVIADFAASRLVTLDAAGAEVASSPLATDDLVGAVASALLELD